jgi:hypothetical protein
MAPGAPAWARPPPAPPPPLDSTLEELGAHPKLDAKYFSEDTYMDTCHFDHCASQQQPACHKAHLRRG